MANLTLAALPEDYNLERLRSRIMDRVKFEDGCWLCSLFINHKGYSTVGVRRSVFRSHRVMWELDRGPIPDGLTIDHLCKNKSCVNPDHMEIVSVAENTARAQCSSFGRGYCKRGHDTSLPGSRTNKGQCIQCRRDAQRDPDYVARDKARRRARRAAAA